MFGRRDQEWDEIGIWGKVRDEWYSKKNGAEWSEKRRKKEEKKKEKRGNAKKKGKKGAKRGEESHLFIHFGFFVNQYQGPHGFRWKSVIYGSLNFIDYGSAQK